jgi:hypothetical protein
LDSFSMPRNRAASTDCRPSECTHCGIGLFFLDVPPDCRNLAGMIDAENCASHLRRTNAPTTVIIANPEAARQSETEMGSPSRSPSCEPVCGGDVLPGSGLVAKSPPDVLPRARWSWFNEAEAHAPRMRCQQHAIRRWLHGFNEAEAHNASDAECVQKPMARAPLLQ